MKSFIAIVPLCVLVATSCPSEEQKIETLHPLWSELNESEDNLDKDKCTFTKLGTGGLRFHVTNHQKPFNSDGFCSKSENNIVQTDTKVYNWFVTPNFYGSVTEDKFPKTMQTGMKYRFCKDDKEGGVPLPFLEEWLSIDPDYKETILIISTGLEGKLGVSESLKKALKDKKEKGEIQDYKILKSKYAVIEHNRCVKEGKKVFTFIHTAG